jgi:hypothetical protein
MEASQNVMDQELMHVHYMSEVIPCLWLANQNDWSIKMIGQGGLLRVVSYFLQSQF